MRMRFVGVPRAMVKTAIGEMEGWKHFGERCLQQAKKDCPVAEEQEGYQGPHLKETLELSVITGSDPRLLIGSKKKGDVLGYLTEGTVTHPVTPTNAKALRWTSGGTVFFSAGHEVKGIDPNPFIMQAVRKTLGKN